MNASLKKIINVFGIIIFSLYTILFITRLIDYLISKYREKEDALYIPKGMLTLVKLIIWIFGILFLLDNLGFKVSTIITGLGIGGIAVALSAQTFLKDLFNYFVIIIDRPFRPGDFINTGSISGMVEVIGIKTTKVRSFSGEQIIVPNTALTDASIKNFKRMDQRTITFTLGLNVNTPTTVLQQVPEIIKGIILSHDDTSFNRAYFKTFGSFTIDYEIQYVILSSDFNKYIETHQSINIAIKDAFENHTIDMPYPTQKIIVES